MLFCGKWPFYVFETDQWVCDLGMHVTDDNDVWMSGDKLN